MLKTDIQGIRAGHNILVKYDYMKTPVERGYTNRTLYINISDLKIMEKPVSQEMKEIFTGGRGFCLWLLWNAVTSETKWNSPENELVIAGGPIGGITQYPVELT